MALLRFQRPTRLAIVSGCAVCGNHDERDGPERTRALPAPRHRTLHERAYRLRASARPERSVWELFVSDAWGTRVRRITAPPAGRRRLPLLVALTAAGSSSSGSRRGGVYSIWNQSVPTAVTCAA